MIEKVKYDQMDPQNQFIQKTSECYYSSMALDY